MAVFANIRQQPSLAYYYAQKQCARANCALPLGRLLPR